MYTSTVAPSRFGDLKTSLLLNLVANRHTIDQKAINMGLTPGLRYILRGLVKLSLPTLGFFAGTYVLDEAFNYPLPPIFKWTLVASAGPFSPSPSGPGLSKIVKCELWAPESHLSYLATGLEMWMFCFASLRSWVRDISVRITFYFHERG